MAGPYAPPPQMPDEDLTPLIERGVSQARNLGAGLSPSGYRGIAEEGRQMADLEDQAEAGDAYAKETLEQRFDAPQPNVEADPVPGYLTREAQDYLLANQAGQRAGAAVGGWVAPRIQRQSLVDYEGQLSQLEQDRVARLRRTFDNPDLDDRTKARLVADINSQHQQARNALLAKRNAHADTYEGLGEQVRMGADALRQTKMAQAAGEYGAEAAGGYERQAILNAQRERLRAEQQSHQKQQQVAAQARQQAQDDYVKATEDWRQAANKAESENPLSTAQSILGGMGVMLASIASMVSGDPGHQQRVLQTLDRTIDRELQKKQRALLNKRQSVEDSQSILGVMRTQMQDEELAYQASRIALKEEFARELEASRESTIGKRNSAGLDATIQAIGLDVETSKAAMLQQAEGIKLQKQQAVDRAAAYDAQRRRDAERRANDPLLSQGAVESDATPNDLRSYVPGVGFARDPESARLLADAAVNFDRIQDNQAEMRRLLASGISPGSEAAARYQSLATRNQALIAVSTGQGAISEGDAERIEYNQPTGDAVFEPRAAERLDASIAEIENARRRHYQYNVAPGVIRYAPDSKGAVRPVRVSVPYGPQAQQGFEQGAVERANAPGGGGQPIQTGAPVAPGGG